MEKYSEKTRKILKKADEMRRINNILLDDNSKFLEEVGYELHVSKSGGPINPYSLKLQ